MTRKVNRIQIKLMKIQYYNVMKGTVYFIMHAATITSTSIIEPSIYLARDLIDIHTSGNGYDNC